MNFKYFKNNTSEKAYYYKSKVSLKECRKIRASKIMKWIVLWPIQLWRIPYSIFLLIKTIYVLAYDFCAEKFAYPGIGVFFVTLGLVLAVFTLERTWPIILSIVIILYFAYCVLRAIYDTRDGYRILYNLEKGYDINYDEYNAKHGINDEEEEDNKTYYYYRSTSSRYDKRYDNSKKTYHNTYEQTKSGQGSPYSQYENGSSTNMFFGLTPEAAKDKYRELMKKYHPDNAKTGDAEKAKEIISMYEEYEEITKN